MTRVLDDGCMACNGSVVYCDAKLYASGSTCCGFCSHLHPHERGTE